MSGQAIRVITGGDITLPAHDRIDVIAAVPTGNEAVASVLTELPDVLVLDTQVDQPDSRAVCRRVREWAPATRVLATSRLDDEALYTTLVAGAAGAMLHEAPEVDWLDAIAATARGESVLQSRMAFRILHDIDAWAERSADPLYPPPTLTSTEREVLGSLGAGQSPATIAATHSVTTHLVNLHASYAVAKLHRYVLGAEKLSAYGV